MNCKTETPVSFVQSEWLREAAEQYANRTISMEQLVAAQDKAIEDLIAAQTECGLDVITDGSLRTIGSSALDFWADFAGVSSKTVLSGRIYQDQYSGDTLLGLVGKLCYNPDHKIFKYHSFLHERVGEGKVVRLDIPAPAHFLLSALREDWLEAGVYDTAEALATDIAEAYNQTIMRLYEQGCRRLLLIDRSWSSLCDRDALKRLTQGGIDPLTLMPMLLSVNESALRELPSDLTVILYTPTASQVNADCADVVKTLFSHSNVTDFMFDLSSPKDADLELLAEFPIAKGLIVGIVNPSLPQLESPSEVKAIVERIAEAAHPTRLALTTAGGFRASRSTIDSTAFTPDDQWRKLHLLQSL